MMRLGLAQAALRRVFATAAFQHEGLTSGQARGEVAQGSLQRDDPWSEWLATVHRPFRTEVPRIDLEFARDRRGWILRQVRSALFPVARNGTLSLANHKEILGDPPSPWIVSVLVEAGREVLSYFSAALAIRTNFAINGVLSGRTGPGARGPWSFHGW